MAIDNSTFDYFGTMGGTGITFDENNFRIDGGVTELEEGVWVYQHISHEGVFSVSFSASQKPQLGDMVVNGVLVPRTLVPNPSRNVFQDEWLSPIINNDPGFQKKKYGREHPNVWPTQGKDA